jgi:hypothetical protein
MINGKVTTAISIHTKIAKEYPQDLISFFFLYQHLIMLGRVSELLPWTTWILPFHKDNIDVSAMHCFALEESNRFDEALEFGFSSRNNDCPWGHHSVCHVFDTQSKLEEGVQWMESHAHHWENCITFMNHHNWWHLSLLYLEKGGSPEKKVIELYDQKVWTENSTWRSDPSVVAGSIGLLWRAELLGMKVDSKWDDIIDHVKPIYRSKISNFLDIHLLYALARHGDHERVEEMLSDVNPAVSDIFKHVSRYGMGKYEDSGHDLPKFEEMWKIGGSNAQRTVFDYTMIDALQKNGKFEESRVILQHYLKPLEDRWSTSRRLFEYRYHEGMKDNQWLNSCTYKEKFNKRI